jgi:hypothetical protein
MSNKKFTCGAMWPSGCTIFTGELPAFIDANSFTCDANLDELLEKYGAKIDDIDDAIDLTSINKGCFDFDPATDVVKDFVQESINKFCQLNTDFISLRNDFNALDISSKLINIDLGSLTPVGDPCAVADQTYTLISILNLLVAEIISLKEQI